MLWLLAGIVLAGCAPAASQPVPVAQPGAAPQPPALAVKKRITVAVRSEPPALWGSVGASSAGAGPEWVVDLFNSDPIAFEPAGNPTALLAEAVPSLDNGSWKLFPDGHMETTVTIRQGAKWHDGMPITADDLIFGATVSKEFLELQLSTNYGSTLFKDLQKLEARDERTVVATWSQPFAQADWLFSYLFGPALPKHILEPSYLADKAGFTSLRFWSIEFVGNGPFVVREFVPGVHLQLTAFDDYVLGRPRIDEIEVRYITDANTLLANLLAGTVDLTLGQGLSIEQATRVQAGWAEGSVIYSPYFLTQAVGYPQFLNPDPPIQSSVQFRRALAYAVDREALVQSIQAGVGSPSSALIASSGDDWDAIKSRVVDYPYDTRRASQMIEDLGYAKGGDGIYHDASNQPLKLALWAAAGDDVYDRTTLAVADMWQRLGIATEQNRVPGNADRSVMPTRPGLQMAALRTEVDTRFLSSETPLPENSFRGGNRARYQSPELDGLLNRYFSTVPRPERQQVLGDIVHYLGDQVVVIHLFYNATPQMMNKRLKNVTPRTSRSNAYNAHLWDVS
jgi:peptide/nickel transport system substrate-binding protein